jgi:hypothetical protein
MGPISEGQLREKIHDQPWNLIKSKVSAIAETLPAAGERAVRARFLVTPPGAEASYELTPPEILSIVQPASALDRSGHLQAQAAQDFLKLARARLRSGQRGGAGESDAGPIAIQAVVAPW